MKVIISNEAKKDMDNIFEYISKNSVKYAIETDKNIRSLTHKLEESPYIGRYVPDLPDKQHRELIYKSYRIVYTIYEETNTIYIRFVIHCKRNFKSFYNTYISKN